MARILIILFIFLRNFYAAELTTQEKEQIQNMELNLYLINWEPFTIFSKEPTKGISIEIWDKIATKSNIKFNYIKNKNFTEALNSIKKDENGMIIATSSTKEREEYGVFTKPIVSFPVSIATNIEKNFIVDLKELEGKNIAVGKSYTSYFLLKENYPKINLIQTEDTLEALDLLAKGKVYAAADILPVLVYTMNKYNFTNLKISGTSTFNFDVKFMLNKKNENLVPIFNKLIDSISENDKKNILNTWIYTKEVVKIDYKYLTFLAIFSLMIISFSLYRQKILRKNKENIEEEKIKYKNLMNLSSDMIFILDFNGKLLEYSKQTQINLGYSDDEMKNLTVYDFDKIITKEEFDNICKNFTDNPIKFQAIHTKKNNETYIADIFAVKISIDETDIIYTSVRDITDQQLLLKEIETSRNRFENMFRTHKSIMLLIDPNNGQIIDANNSANDFYGYTQEEFKNLNISKINTLSIKEIQNNTQKALTLNTNEFIFLHKLKNGESKVVEVSSSPIETPKGKILFSIIKDITKEKKLESDIIHEKNFISNIINNANSIIALIDSNGVMFRVNKYTQDFLGLTQEEISSKEYFWSKFFQDEKKEKIIEIIEKANKGEVVKSFKSSLISKNDEKKIFEWSNTLVKKDNGTMDYLVTIGIDVTEKEEIQNKILEQKQEFESIFKYSKDGIAITDLKTNFLEFNDAYQQITGYEKDELLQKSSLELATKEHKEIMIKQIELAIKNGHIENYEKESIAKNRRIIVNMSISLLPDKKRLLIVIKDITLLKQIENQTKLMAMGEMIGNIAHQWRQPLSVITSAVSSLRVKSELEIMDKQDIIEASEVIVKQSNYLSNTIDNFRNFIKVDTPNTNFSLITTIQNAIGIVEATLKNSYIKLILNLDDDLTLKGNINELIEAFINILTNSKDILNEKINENDKRLILIKTKRIDNDSIEVKFLDNAGGMDENLINRILEPYFTTKHQSQGTGLGLSITDKIVRERYKGLINIYNEEFIYKNKKYKGLCFSIIFKSN